MRTQNTMLYIALCLLAGAAYLYWTRSTPPPAPPRLQEEAPVARPRSVPAPPSARPVVAEPAAPSVRRPRRIAPLPADGEPTTKRPVLHYNVDDGVAVVQGDVAVGVPVDPAATSGVIQLAPVKRWDQTTIPYYIQPGVENAGRVQQALAMFAGTGLKFVEYAGQEDALVFEPTTGICKSYLGRIGGRQPVWIAPGCGPVEIAHEIMHALGFAHEQNRADRDEHITVNIDGIEDEYRYNFEKLPATYTELNQKAPFDFTSIMMYPPWMFAKGGQTTMFPRDPDQRIAPGPTLSPSDVLRLSK